MRHSLVSVPAAVLALVLLTPGVQAALFTIAPDGSGDYPTIQAAVDASSPRDTLELLDGVFTGTGNHDVLLNRDWLLIRSHNGNPQACIVDVNGLGDRGFTIGAWGCSLSGITVRGANTDGLYRSDQQYFLLNLFDCVFTENGRHGVYGTQMGGEFRNCVFSRNGSTGARVEFHSGAVFNSCRFEENGGAVTVGTYCQPAFSDCFFLRNGGQTGLSCIAVAGMSSPSFDRCVFFENSASSGGVLYLAQAGAALDHCTIVSNHCTEDGSLLRASGESGIGMTNCIVAGNTGGALVSAEGLSVDLVCMDIFGNEGGDYIGPFAGEVGRHGNFSADPRICDPLEGNFGLAADSPCAPGPSSCGLIGALGVACGIPVGVQDASIGSRVILAPNPSGGSTRIDLAGFASGSIARISVFDVAGRVVADLAVPLRSGAGSVEWDGRDQSGHRAPAGVYACRIRAGEAEMNRVLVRLN